jgi:hypothetical protein
VRVKARLKKSGKDLRFRGPMFIDQRGDAAPIFKQERGKPSVRKEFLEQQRDTWIWVLEPSWADIGWGFESARTPEGVCDAFKAVRSHPELLAPFLRNTTERSSVGSIALLRKEHEKAVRAVGADDEAYRKAYEEHREAERIAFTLGKDYEKNIKQDLLHRTENIRLLRIEKSRTKSRLRRYAILREKHAKAKPKKRDFAPFLEAKLRRIQSDLAADEKVCVDLQSRFRLITPAARKLAQEELESRKMKRDLAGAALRDSNAKCDDLQTKLLDQEAFLYRQELSDFIASGKYAIEPRQLAKALAGLPHMKCRRSAERCFSLRSSVPVAMNYELFSFISSCWERRAKRGAATPLVEWFRKEILRLRKWFRREGRKVENPLRVRLAKDWYFLKRAVEEARGPMPGKIPKQYFVVQQFLSRSANPLIPTDRILADRESLVD